MTTVPDFELADRLSRQRIREALDDSLVVEAGAGTGKTAALVDRYVALILAGRSVERLVAITFTEKAAAELRDRVRQALEERHGRSEPGEEAQRIENALGALDRAQISTIHAFCAGLLRSFAVRAGIDPAFQIDDEVAAFRRFEERWRLYLDSLGADQGAVNAIGRVLDLGLTARNLQELARELWSRTDLAERLRAAPLTVRLGASLELAALRAELEAIDRRYVPPHDRLFKRIDDLITVLDELIEAGDEGDARLASLVPTLKKEMAGTRPNWIGSSDIETVRGTCNEVVRQLSDALEQIRSVALAEALPFVVDFVVEEARSRAMEGRLVFDDLILYVRNVLRDDVGARVELRQRFDTILIDEFQDTDPLQAEIALAFASEPESGIPEPGRLFLVGDPKQSIYRFRRADMAVYAATVRQLEQAGAQKLALALNRRSLPGILDWVNQVFDPLFATALHDQDVQPQYMPIGPQRSERLDGSSVSCFGSPADRPAGEIRAIEANHIAAYCREIVARGWQVSARGEAMLRTARFGDIAVLLPTRTSLQPLERALAAENIPYRVEGGSLVYATQEVRDLINCLTAIDDPSDGVAVVAALRSPAYACSDVELARYRSAGGSFNYTSPVLAGLQDLVADCLRDLQAWHRARPGLTLAALVEAFVDARRLVEVGLIDSGNRNAFRRARFLVEQARGFDANGPESLRSFVEWLERRANDAILDYEGAGLDDDEDAVRVLTIHAAKGLEFPIVFLAGLGAAPSNAGFVFGRDRKDESVAVSIGSKTRGNQFTLGDVDRLTRREKQHIEAERDRLLYVAATRARDHLIVSLYHKIDAQQSAAARLLQKQADQLAVSMPPVQINRPMAAPPFAGLEIDLPDLDDDAFAAGRQALVAAGRRQAYTSATALRKEKNGTQPDEEEERADETEPWSHGRAATHLGRAVHAALQTLPWDAGAGAIRAVAAAQTVAEAIPEREAEAARLIGAALASEAARRARSAARALREVPFSLGYADGRLIVEGYVDLLIENQDGSLEIVDWKTDHVSQDAAEARMQDYELQAGVYVAGIEAATGRQVSSVTYVFVSLGREYRMPDPQALAGKARLRLDAEARALPA